MGDFCSHEFESRKNFGDNFKINYFTVSFISEGDLTIFFEITNPNIALSPTGISSIYKLKNGFLAIQVDNYDLRHLHFHDLQLSVGPNFSTTYNVKINDDNIRKLKYNNIPSAFNFYSIDGRSILGIGADN